MKARLPLQTPQAGTLEVLCGRQYDLTPRLDYNATDRTTPRQKMLAKQTMRSALLEAALTFVATGSDAVGSKVLFGSARLLRISAAYEEIEKFI